MIFRRSRGIRLRRQQWLRSIPVRMVEDFTEDDNGIVTILVELEYKGLIGKIIKAISLTPPPKYKRIVLDKMGSIVWKMCDGKHTVEDIVRRLMTVTGLSRRNVELAVYHYIKTLVMKGLIELRISET